MLQADPAEATAGRKADHLRINVERDVAGKGVTNGFERWRFEHQALPEIDLDDVDCSTALFGRALRAPLLISCMTGGTPAARELNLRLARVAYACGIAMGVGSGRALLERPDALRTFDVRDVMPGLPLLANIGAVQLNCGYTIDDCRRLVEMLRADALVLHLNALQEAVQEEGDTRFGGLLPKIALLCASMDVPVVVKEVGWGIAPDTARRLLDAGVAALDLAGAGGTSWTQVERERLSDARRRNVAAAFAGWGIPTAESLASVRAAAPGATLIASGGLHDGVEVAKAIALGANLAGLAGPFLRAADRGEETALDFAWELVQTLRTAMFAVGAPTLRDLRAVGRLREVNR
jgi:isopentenyl-diphosphate delta-isomerase